MGDLFHLVKLKHPNIQCIRNRINQLSTKYTSYMVHIQNLNSEGAVFDESMRFLEHYKYIYVPIHIP